MLVLTTCSDSLYESLDVYPEIFYFHTSTRSNANYVENENLLLVPDVTHVPLSLSAHLKHTLTRHVSEALMTFIGVAI